MVAAEREPAEVVHGIAEMRELPVEQRRDARAVVEEVAGADIAVTQHGVGALGRVACEPSEREARERRRALHARVEDAAPEREFGERVIARVLWARKTRQLELRGVHAVQLRERLGVIEH